MKTFGQEERILTELTALYEKRGYAKVRAGSFDDYSLYLENRDFLIHRKVITFNGADGRLLALRPDVTLSLINRVKPELCGTEKYYYTEKVYRQTADGGDFKEISQTGVEMIGQIDCVCQTELLVLILDVLSALSQNYALDLSHMGMVGGLISSFPVDEGEKRLFYSFLQQKNFHDFQSEAKKCRLSARQIEAFRRLISLGGDAVAAVKECREIALNERMLAAAEQLEELVASVAALGYAERIGLNFSTVNNADYYNGVIFKGYVDGVPRAVLSGGRYDGLLKKVLARKGGQKRIEDGVGAIGFALYLGELEKYMKTERRFVDYLLVYDDATQGEALAFAAEQYRANRSVYLSRGVTAELDYGQLVDLTGGGRK